MITLQSKIDDSSFQKFQDPAWINAETGVKESRRPIHSSTGRVVSLRLGHRTTCGKRRYTRNLTDRPRFPTVHYLVLSLCTISFFLSGLALIPYIGIQTDEALFANGLFDNGSAWFQLSVFKKKIPLMVMSYIGATKTAIYSPVFHWFGASAYSLRIPMLVLATATIPMLYFFLRRAACPKVALTAAGLLSFDAAYLLTATMDWGPVAIQHVCLLLGMLLNLKAFQEKNRLALACGWFFFGLGMWDKALFAWLLSAVVIAAAIVFPQETRRNLTLRCVTTAGFFFLLGSLPLVIYNVRRPLETVRGNASFSSEDLANKIRLLSYTLDGSALFGYLVEEDWPVTQRDPVTVLERASLGLAGIAGERRHSLYGYAFAGSLFLAPVLLFTCWRRPVLFCLIAIAVSWGQMLATKGAGGGAHHSILLWPLPLILIAIPIVWLGEKSGRAGRYVVLFTALVFCGSGLLVINHYLAQAIRNGSPGSWSNAIFPLSDALSKYNARKIFLTDWGMTDNLRLLHQGRLPLLVASGPLMNPEASARDVHDVESMFKEKDAIFVSNTDDRQVFPEVNARLKNLSERLGYRRELLEVIRDGNGRPCFEIFRFAKI